MKTIGIISPCSWIKDEYLEMVSKFLQDNGFNVKISEQSYLKTGYVAGSDKERVDALHNAFQDSEIDIILCAKGGYGAIRLLDLIDYELINKNSKPFIGYSDATMLNLAFIKKCPNIPIYFGPNAIDIAYLKGDIKDVSLNCLKSFLQGNENNDLKSDIIRKQTKVLKHGKCEGLLVGGTLTILMSTLATDIEIDTDNKILFFEEKKEYTFKIERMLYQLKRAKKLDNIKGVIIGSFYEEPEYHIPFGKSTYDAILEVFSDKNVPIIANFPAGHAEPKIPLPLTKLVSIDTKSSDLVCF